MGRIIDVLYRVDGTVPSCFFFLLFSFPFFFFFFGFPVLQRFLFRRKCKNRTDQTAIGTAKGHAVKVYVYT